MALHGVDIASYQKDMDCSKIKGDFVIVKCSQGNNYVNPHMKRHIAQAKSAGKLIGLYHYATGIGAETEADFFILNARDYIREAILCLDWEHNEPGGRNPVFNSPQEVNYVEAFMQRVHAKTGVWPLLYMSASVTRRRNWSKVAAICELWVAQYASKTKITDYQESPWRDNKGLGAWIEPPAIHQYSSSGNIEGYRQTSPGKLDMDIAYISRQEWIQLAQGTYKKLDKNKSKEVTPSVVLDVISGKYGAGAERTIKLAQAGYNAVTVQQKINECYAIAKEMEKYKTKSGSYWQCVLKFLL